jgi:hypothetical protein
MYATEDTQELGKNLGLIQNPIAWEWAAGVCGCAGGHRGDKNKVFGDGPEAAN